MNPEIRFRVTEEIYQQAEGIAEELGLATGGRSAGVPLLARAAFYDWVGLAWPEELPRPDPTMLRAGKRGLAPETSAQAVLEVHHRVSGDTRLATALDSDRAVPELGVTILRCSPQEVPKSARAYLRLDEQGNLKGQIRLLELESSQIELSWKELDDFLKTKRTARKEMRAGTWEATLRKWSLEHGSEWLRARLEEGFEWRELAEQEWAEHKVQAVLAGQSPLMRVQEQQSLEAETDFHALLPDRQPTWPRIQLLREYRGRLEEGGPVQISLVHGRHERVEARHRGASRPFHALLWQVEVGDRGLYSFLSHLESSQAPISPPSRKTQTLA